MMKENDIVIANEYFENDMLFHYTTLETGIEKILNQMQLRLGSFISVNDPNEKKSRGINIDWIDGSITDENKLYGIDYIEIMNSVRLYESKLICFSKNRDNALEFIEDKNEPGNYYRTGFFKPRMWAQYGANHRGICIAISKESLAKEMYETYGSKRVYRSDIKYTDSTKDIHKPYQFELTNEIINDFKKYFIEEHIVKYRNELFFSKTNDWRDEQEYRFLLIAEDRHIDYYVNIEKAIRGIFLGVDFPNVYIDALKKNLNNRIDVFQLVINNGIPEVIKK